VLVIKIVWGKNYGMGWGGNEYPCGRFEISTAVNLDMGIGLNGELFN
jgi:hypothetical protein